MMPLRGKYLLPYRCCAVHPGPGFDSYHKQFNIQLRGCDLSHSGQEARVFVFVHVATDGGVSEPRLVYLAGIALDE